MAWYTVKTYYKKSCEQREFFRQRDGDGSIRLIEGFRWAEYNVETNDDKFPDFQFTEVPDGDGKKDSIDLNACFGSNIESTELVMLDDGGCWSDIDITGIEDDDELEQLQEFIDEEGVYALEDNGDWFLDDTEVWVWGPLEVTDEEGNTRIICADENGNVVDFEEK